MVMETENEANAALVKTQMIRVGQQDLWVAVKPGLKDRPPLLLFNGIGANLELADPFMRAMTDVEVVIFDIPGVGGSPCRVYPTVRQPSLDGRSGS